MQSQNSPAKATKRRHTLAFKRKLVGLTNKPGASVAAIALEHGVNANLVFKWKREQLGRATAATQVRFAVLLPVTIDPLPPMCTVTPSVATNSTRAAPVGVIAIEFGGARVRLRGVVDHASGRCVLQTLREAA